MIKREEFNNWNNISASECHKENYSSRWVLWWLINILIRLCVTIFTLEILHATCGHVIHEINCELLKINVWPLYPLNNYISNFYYIFSGWQTSVLPTNKIYRKNIQPDFVLYFEHFCKAITTLSGWREKMKCHKI